MQNKKLSFEPHLSLKNTFFQIIDDTKNARHKIQVMWRTSYNIDQIVKIIDVYENQIEYSKYFFIVME